jgi:hypothetical protein
MDNTFETILILIVGWLLGLLSPAIIDAIRRRRENKEVSSALRTELEELRYRLACVVFRIEQYHGEPNKKALEWFHEIVKNYTGLNPSENILNELESLIVLTDQQFKTFISHLRASPEKGLSLKKYPVPLLESKFALLSGFNTPFQNRLLEIRTNLNMLHEEVDQARFYHQLTFNPTEDNYEIVRNNLFNTYREYAFRAKILIDHIGQIRW